MTFKRIISIFFIICAVVALSACKPEDANETAAPEAETEAPEAAKLVFIDNGKTDFRVTRSEDAEGYYLDTAQSVYRKLKDEYSSDFKQGEDWINPLEPDPTKGHEILLFPTVRDESAAAVADLTFDGYMIRVTDLKIVIVGTGISQCNAALNEFFNVLIPEYTADGVTAFPVGLEIKKELEGETLDFGAALSSGKNIGAHITEVFSYPVRDGFNASQGAATDGKYVYIVVKRNDGGHETDKIVKIDPATWEVVKVSEVLELDHANDMTYDTSRSQLAVVHMVDGLISFIDTETLTVKETVRHPFHTSSLEFIEETGQYLLRAGNGYFYTDKNLVSLSEHAVNGYPADHDKYTGQGMYADSSYLYIPRSPTAGLPDNIIIVCDAEGKYLTTVRLATKMESETIFTLNGRFYVNFSRSASAICEVEFYEVFE